ncbi:hypothetical protein [Leeuwenhoekiella sp. NPDC079379]|uniref:hypothetical protein n=1 Tax=Leeuwenhoekiella sp. NPDC079379 TaxID=3364122 RepID=UPI0037CAF4F4
MNNATQSINIIRDSGAKFNYIVTPNAVQTSDIIFQNFEKGYHSFNLIGSFGTGKSSFLWALEKSLTSEKEYFKSKFNGKTELIKIVGDYRSLNSALNDEFEISKDLPSNQKLFDNIYQRYEKLKEDNGLLIIVIDEFGKFLEYASKNNKESELYFLQKLAEFVNEPSRNIILINSLHQSLESYAYDLNNAQVQEWRKVKGRFIDIPFNEPVEQLILLASEILDGSHRANNTIANSKLIIDFDLFSFQNKDFSEIENKLHPLSAISSYALANALQRYGQNERSLFTFLNSIYFDEFIDSKKHFELAELYDFLFQEFYGFITNKRNPDQAHWLSIKNALERAELITDFESSVIDDLLKTIGILSIFAKKSAQINIDFLNNYFQYRYSNDVIEESLKLLEKHKIIRFSKFNQSFKIFEGTDLDIEFEISKAENRIEGIDLLKKLKSHFDFPVIIAKSATYNTGTPRLFEFVLSDKPEKNNPEGQIDGFVNLIFNDNSSDLEEIRRQSENSSTLFGCFNNTADILDTLFEIEKTNEVLKNIQGDKDLVAIRELKSIIRSNENLLNHYVMSSLYSSKVVWMSLGKDITIRSQKDFNQSLTRICTEIYSETPIIQNELINRHKTSGSISSSRKTFWKALTNNYHLEDLGFEKDKWPAEKTIYYSLLKNTGIHLKQENEYIFSLPTDPGFQILWERSMEFLNETKNGRKSILDFNKMLSEKPIKLKQGVIDFWIPTFLFIKRGDFALYNENGFVPYLDETILYMMNRNPKEFTVKSFVLNDLRLNLFNKYRDFLRQENKNSFNTDSFIESIRPLLIFYRDLTQYSKTTSTISKEGIKLRNAISKAVDPEKTFFEEFPEALGYSLKELAVDNKLFEDYIITFQNTIEEIKTSFDELVNRFELFICKEILGGKFTFEAYQKKLQDRFSSIKEHQALSRHKVLLLRINSNLADRNSYLMSIAQALLGKPLNTIRDQEERILIDKFRNLVNEMDDLSDLELAKVDEDDFLMKLQLTTPHQGNKSKVLRLNSDQKKIVEERMNYLSGILDKDDTLKIPILVALLNKELDKDEKA